MTKSSKDKQDTAKVHYTDVERVVAVMDRCDDVQRAVFEMAEMQGIFDKLAEYEESDCRVIIELAHVWKLLRSMPEEDRAIVIQKPESTNRAADSLYRRRCAKWGIDTSARGVTKRPDYNRVHTLKQRLADIEDEQSVTNCKLANAETLLAHARIMLERSAASSDGCSAEGAKTLRDMQSLLAQAAQDVARYNSVVAWFSDEICDTCFGLMIASVKEGVRQKDYCLECSERIEKILSYASRERLKRKKEISRIKI